MNPSQTFSRRQMLRNASCGFGSLALASLLDQQKSTAAQPLNPLAAKVPLVTPKAKRVIFIFMQGGPSQMDTFDYKPDLFSADGKEIDFTGVRFGTFGKHSKRKLMKPMWDFARHGESGRWVSSLFPHIARHVDDLCFLKGMHTEGVAHGPATLFMHTGATNLVRPSMGSWISYGLGSENENLPAFISIGPSQTKGGPRNIGTAFLPAVHQGTAIGRAEHPETQRDFAYLRNHGLDNTRQIARYNRLRQLNRAQMDRQSRAGEFAVDGVGFNGLNVDDLEATIESYELAFRMQQFAPHVLNIANESAETLEMYGLNDKATESFGRQCLLGRRLAESGVRYIQLNYANESPNPPWDQHSNMPAHAEHALATDKPVAGLLADLKRRGMLDDTLVWWGGEFGRTPFSQNNNGRDHNPRGFTVFLAGGGVKPGMVHGATDEISHYAVEGKTHMHDLHATILHLLGLDHEQLTYRYAGRDFRLTDVAGRVVHDIIT